MQGTTTQNLLEQFGFSSLIAYQIFSAS